MSYLISIKTKFQGDYVYLLINQCDLICDNNFVMIINDGDIVKKINFDDIVFTEINKKGYLLIHAFKRNKCII